LLLLLGLNVSAIAHRRVAAQSAADASAYTAGVCYARGLNAIAVTNDIMVASGMIDLLVFLAAPEAEMSVSGGVGMPPPVLYRTIARAQDWFVTAWRVVSFEEPVRIGLANGALAVQIWDDTPGAAIVPRFNVKRTYLLEDAFPALKAKAKGTSKKLGDSTTDEDREKAERNRKEAMKSLESAFKGQDTSRTYLGTDETESYRYWDSAKKKWVNVKPGQVEKVVFRRRGKRVEQFRVKSASKRGGYFVERNAAKRKSWDIPLPLIEEDPAHVVLSCIAKSPERLPFDPFHTVALPSALPEGGASAVSSGLPPMVALAECEVFGGSLGYWFSNPSWTTRFCRVRMPEESGHLLEGDLRELAGKESGLNKRIKH